MKMGKIEKWFMNKSQHTEQVTNRAEKLWRMATFTTFPLAFAKTVIEERIFPLARIGQGRM